VKAALRRLWESRAPRERITIAALAGLLAVASYILVVHSAESARGKLRTSVATLRTQAALLEQQAAEHERLRATPATPASPSNLRALVQARVDAARLSGAVTRIDAADADHVNLVVGAASFADWLAFVAALQEHQVRLEAARIEALASPGLVSVNATFARARLQ
jgi:general secretion pathway protein M